MYNMHICKDILSMCISVCGVCVYIYVYVGVIVCKINIQIITFLLCKEQIALITSLMLD